MEARFYGLFDLIDDVTREREEDETAGDDNAADVVVLEGHLGDLGGVSSDGRTRLASGATTRRCGCGTGERACVATLRGTRIG